MTLVAEQITKADRLRVSRSLRKKANPGATLRRLSSTVLPIGILHDQNENVYSIWDYGYWVTINPNLCIRNLKRRG